MTVTATLTYNGVTIGAGQDLQVVELEGVWETPEVRTSDVDRSRAHGQWQGVDLLGGRAITATVQANVAIDDPAWTSVQSALVATGDELPLTLQLTGFAGGGQVSTDVRVRRVSVPVEVERYPFGAARLVVEWWATDPRFYSTSTSSESSGISSPTGSGLTFNATFDLGFGGAIASGVINVLNGGNFAAPWVATITGPVTDPRIEHVDLGRTLEFDGEVQSGETLTVSSATKTVTLNGASRYSWLQPGSEWFDLPPGANQVRFGAQSGTGTGTLTFKSAWI